MNKIWRACAGLIVAGSLTACGGGSGGGGTIPPPSGGGNGYTPGVFQPFSTFAHQCAAPRSGTNPATGQPFPDQPGTASDEKFFLRSWTNELYLWYDEVQDRNPATYQVLEYFDLLRTEELTASGQPKDKFHFTYDSEDWYQLSQSGVSAGYGAQWVILSPTPPRSIVVAYVEPNSPAEDAGLARGDEVLEIDGMDAVNGNTQAIVDVLNAGLFPEDDETYDFLLRDTQGSVFDVTMTAEQITSDPVPNVQTIATASGPVGYLLFNDHIATAEPALIEAVETLEAANITDLILDIRYNGGGYLAIASQLAYMIAGTTPTAGQFFERLSFNDKHPTTNPVTGQALTPTPFYSTTVGIGTVTPGIALPTLDLQRVYVLTGSNTCSASEAIMNGLRGVGVDVYQIGATTCGKPYGFYARDNCGTTYFSIQFRGENADGFGDYSDGFIPDSTASGTSGDRVPGCLVADDLESPLGDENEGRLAAALSFRASNNQTCPAASSMAPGTQLKPGQVLPVSDGVMYKSPFHQNRIMHR